MKLFDLCNQNVVKIRKDDSVLDAAKLLRNEHVGCLIVIDETVDNTKPIAMVTDRDIVIKALAPNVDLSTTHVNDITTSKFITANAQDDVHTALDLMRRHGIRRIPLVDDDDNLVGIITVDDLFAHLSEELHGLSRAIYMEQRREKIIEAKIA